MKQNEVWLLIDSRLFGGIESHILELSSALNAYQFPVHVILLTRYDDGHLLAEKLKQFNLPFLILSEQYPTLSQADALMTLIGQRRPSVIHSHGYKASLLAKYTKLRLKIRHKINQLVINRNLNIHKTWRQITTFHAGETPAGRVRLYDFIDRISAFLSNTNIAVSRKIQNKIIAPTRLFNNFVNTEQSTASRGQQIAFVGRLSHEKAPDRLITIAKQLPQYHFDCYGDGPLMAWMKKNSPSNLSLHGHQSSMAGCWDNIGVLIICSRAEGLPMAALEAMSRSIPVIAMAVGELPTLIEHQHNGYLCQSEQALTQAIIDWFSLTPATQHLLRAAARQTVEQHYSRQAVIPQFIALYQDEFDSQFENGLKQ
jgi:glycosyltransferase involved in cell wall biosynthesis